MDGRIGIVLGGGGGAGSYQIGIWKALERLEVAGKITGVSGTSAGALNGTLFCTGALSQAIRAWSHVSEDMILKPHVIDRSVMKNYPRRNDYNGWFTNEGIKEMIDQYADLEAVKNSPMVFYATASRVRRPALLYEYVKAHSAGKLLHKAVAALYLNLLAQATVPRYFRVNDYPPETIENIILASAAIPFIFPDINIGGSIYVDGGIDDNVPILPLFQDGFRRLVVVGLDSDYQIPAEKFPGADFLDLSIRNIDKIRQLINTFDFTAASAGRHMRQGYEDGMAQRTKIEAFFKD